MTLKALSNPGQMKLVKSFYRFPKALSNLIARFKIRIWTANLARFIQYHPFTSFFTTLGLLLGFIVIGSIITRPQSNEQIETITPKQVEIYSIGDSPTITVQGKVEKESIVRISAQMSGIVSSINVKEGDRIKKGTNLLQLSSTYDGSNQATIQAHIAQKQYDIASETYPIQKEAIKKQRELAEKTAKNNDELRIISEKSLEDTRTIQAQNNEILETLNQNLQILVQNNTDSETDQTAILQAKQLRTQYQSSVAMLNNQIRTLEYQIKPDNPPNTLTEIQKDLTLKQLDIQEKTLDISLDIAKLQRNLAFIVNSLMHPTSPVDGTVESVLVTRYQQVNPGTPLFVISGSRGTTKVRVDVTQSIAHQVSSAYMSTLIINGKEYNLKPYYVSSEATSANLYSIYFVLPDGNDTDVADGEYIPVALRLEDQKMGSAIPFVPLDAVYQTQGSSFVYVVNGDRANAREVRLGNVFGSYVVVEEGLSEHDTVILDRTIVDGDRITTIHK